MSDDTINGVNPFIMPSPTEIPTIPLEDMCEITSIFDNADTLDGESEGFCTFEQFQEILSNNHSDNELYSQQLDENSDLYQIFSYIADKYDDDDTGAEKISKQDIEQYYLEQTQTYSAEVFRQNQEEYMHRFEDLYKKEGTWDNKYNFIKEIFGGITHNDNKEALESELNKAVSLTLASDMPDEAKKGMLQIAAYQKMQTEIMHQDTFFDAVQKLIDYMSIDETQEIFNQYVANNSNNKNFPYKEIVIGEDENGDRLIYMNVKDDEQNLVDYMIDKDGRILITQETYDKADKKITPDNACAVLKMGTTTVVNSPIRTVVDCPTLNNSAFLFDILNNPNIQEHIFALKADDSIETSYEYITGQEYISETQAISNLAYNELVRDLNDQNKTPEEKIDIIISNYCNTSQDVTKFFNGALEKINENSINRNQKIEFYYNETEETWGFTKYYYNDDGTIENPKVISDYYGILDVIVENIEELNNQINVQTDYNSIYEFWTGTKYDPELVALSDKSKNIITSIEGAINNKEAQNLDGKLADATTPLETFEIFLDLNENNEDLAIEEFNKYCEFLFNSSMGGFIPTLSAEKDENNNIKFIVEYKTNNTKFDLYDFDPVYSYYRESLFTQYNIAQANINYFQEQYAQEWFYSEECEQYIQNKVQFQYEIFYEPAAELRSQIEFFEGMSFETVDSIIEQEYWLNQLYQASDKSMSYEDFIKAQVTESGVVDSSSIENIINYAKYMESNNYSEAQKFSLIYTAVNGKQILERTIATQIMTDMENEGCVSALNKVLESLKFQQEATYGENELEKLYQEYKIDMATYPDRLRSAVTNTLLTVSLLSMAGVSIPVNPFVLKLASIACSGLPDLIRLENLTTNQVDDSLEKDEIQNQQAKCTKNMIHTTIAIMAGMYCNKLNSDQVAKLLKAGETEMQALLEGAVFEIIADFSSGCAIDYAFDNDPNFAGNFLNVLFDIAGDVTTWNNFQSGKGVLGNQEYNIRNNPDGTQTVTITENGKVASITKNLVGDMIAQVEYSDGRIVAAKYGQNGITNKYEAEQIGNTCALKGFFENQLAQGNERITIDNNGDYKFTLDINGEKIQITGVGTDSYSAFIFGAKANGMDVDNLSGADVAKMFGLNPIAWKIDSKVLTNMQDGFLELCGNFKIDGDNLIIDSSCDSHALLVQGYENGKYTLYDQTTKQTIVVDESKLDGCFFQGGTLRQTEFYSQNYDIKVGAGISTTNIPLIIFDFSQPRVISTATLNNGTVDFEDIAQTTSDFINYYCKNSDAFEKIVNCCIDNSTLQYDKTMIEFICKSLEMSYGDFDKVDLNTASIFAKAFTSGNCEHKLNILNNILSESTLIPEAKIEILKTAFQYDPNDGEFRNIKNAFVQNQDFLCEQTLHSNNVTNYEYLLESAQRYGVDKTELYQYLNRELNNKTIEEIENLIRITPLYNQANYGNDSSIARIENWWNAQLRRSVSERDPLFESIRKKIIADNRFGNNYTTIIINGEEKYIHGTLTASSGVTGADLMNPSHSSTPRNTRQAIKDLISADTFTKELLQSSNVQQWLRTIDPNLTTIIDKFNDTTSGRGGWGQLSEYEIHQITSTIVNNYNIRTGVTCVEDVIRNNAELANNLETIHGLASNLNSLATGNLDLTTDGQHGAIRILTRDLAKVYSYSNNRYIDFIPMVDQLLSTPISPVGSRNSPQTYTYRGVNCDYYIIQKSGKLEIHFPNLHRIDGRFMIVVAYNSSTGKYSLVTTF